MHVMYSKTRAAQIEAREGVVANDIQIGECFLNPDRRMAMRIPNSATRPADVCYVLLETGEICHIGTIMYVIPLSEAFAGAL